VVLVQAKLINAAGSAGLPVRPATKAITSRDADGEARLTLEVLGRLLGTQLDGGVAAADGYGLFT